MPLPLYSQRYPWVLATVAKRWRRGNCSCAWNQTPTVRRPACTVVLYRLSCRRLARREETCESVGMSVCTASERESACVRRSKSMHVCMLRLWLMSGLYHQDGPCRIVVKVKWIGVKWSDAMVSCALHGGTWRCNSVLVVIAASVVVVRTPGGQTSFEDGTEVEAGLDVATWNKSYSCPCAGHEGVWGSGNISPVTLNFRTRWTWVAAFTPRLLYFRYAFSGIETVKFIL